MKDLAPRLRHALSVVACAIIVLLPTLINGFPFVFSDTGTYLRSAFEGYVPFDRPYWYGVFLRATSLGGTTLWGAVIAQALLCGAYVRRTTSLVLGPGRAGRTAIVASTVLTAATGLGWYVGQLMPDVFTGIGLLATYALLRGRSAPWARCMDILVIVLCCWVHLSNLLILPLAGAVLVLIGRRSRPTVFRSDMARLGAVIVLAWGGLALANRVVDGKAYVSRAGHVFLVGRMLDTGMLRPYLEEHCPTEHFGICAYMDSLPDRSETFLWGSGSPVMAQGGWDATKAEYDRIVQGSLTEPRFFWWHVCASLASTAEQLGTWEVTEKLQSTWYRTAGSPPCFMIAKCMPQELAGYLGSMQNGGRGELDMTWPDALYRSGLAISLLVLAWSIIAAVRNGPRPEVWTWMIYSLAAVIIAAWACSTLSMVAARYLGRDSWLIPFAAILVIAHERQRRRARG